MVEMEPINLVTGLPGAGKTLFGIHLLTKCKAEGLRCYNFNVKELDPEIAEPYPFGDDISRWRELPERSVVIVDEAHGVFPVRPVNAKEPEHINAFAEIRHGGRRFIIIDQDPSTLDRFVKRRVGAHFHLVNRTGYDNARVFSNRGCVDNPRAAGAWSVGESDLWRYPKDLYTRYKSASLHIKRRKIPRMAYVLVGAVLLLVGSLWWTFTSFTFGLDEPEPVVEGVGTTPGASGAGVVPTAGRDLGAQLFNAPPGAVYMTAEQWARAHTPLVEGVPWSAPVFADRQVTTTPDLYCVVVGELGTPRASCRCYSEQMTPVKVQRNVCIAAARDGVYNPYRTRGYVASAGANVPTPAATATSPVPSTGTGGVVGAALTETMKPAGTRPYAAPPPVPGYSGVR